MLWVLVFENLANQCLLGELTLLGEFYITMTTTAVL